MIEFKANGVSIPVGSCEMVMDIQNFYTVFEITSYAQMLAGSTITMQGEAAGSLVVLQSVLEEDTYKYTCVTQDQWDTFKVVTQPFQGTASIKTLLSKIGFKCIFEEDSNPSWWMLPQLSYKGVLQALNRWTVIVNGGAPRFFLDLKANVRYVDLKKSLTDKPASIAGDVVSDYLDIEWLNNVPGNIDIYHMDKDSLSVEQLSLNNNLPTVKVFVNDTTQNVLSLRKQSFINEYNYRLLTSRTITMSGVFSAPHRVGQHVVLNGKVKGIITGIRIPFSISNESTRLTVRIGCQGL